MRVSSSLHSIRIAILVLCIFALGACQRVQRPFAGESKAPAGAPKYTVPVDLNGVGGQK